MIVTLKKHKNTQSVQQQQRKHNQGIKLLHLIRKPEIHCKFKKKNIEDRADVVDTIKA